MKTILAICAVVLVAAIAIFAMKLSKREDHFGKAFTGRPVASIPDMIAKPAQYVGREFRINGILKRQCPATGCWFFLADPGDASAMELKVEMGDTTPKLPARLGRLATVEGQLIKYGEGYEFIGVAVTFAEDKKP